MSKMEDKFKLVTLLTKKWGNQVVNMTLADFVDWGEEELGVRFNAATMSKAMKAANVKTKRMDVMEGNANGVQATAKDPRLDRLIAYFVREGWMGHDDAKQFQG